MKTHFLVAAFSVFVRILPTLAWFLARRDSVYRSSLLYILRDVPDVADYAIEMQVEYLLIEPFRQTVINQKGERPLLVLVIDALDECAETEEVKELLNKLLSISSDFPVKFFLTSRPERHIRMQFESPQSKLHRVLRLHDIEQDLVQEDIFLYINARLKGIRSSSVEDLPPDWPARRDVQQLTRLAGKLFIYASTATRYIEDQNHVYRLQTLTGFTVIADQPFHDTLDQMYLFVLTAALDPKKCTQEEIGMTKKILAMVLATRVPLCLSDLARLLSISPHDIRVNLARIHAVIHVPPVKKDGVVSMFHASFADFLTTPGRAPENMVITLSTAHRILADGCLRIMNSDLHFNIAECQTSYLPNSEQILSTISPSLMYSCLHWAHHVVTADNVGPLLSSLEIVLLQKFLFWLEVLSATGTVNLASSTLMRVLTAETTVRRSPACIDWS